QVSLNIVLIDTEILKVDKEAINQYDPECRFGKVEIETPEAELLIGRTYCEHLCRSLRQRKQQDQKTGQRAANKHNTLDRVRPHNGLDASHHGIDHDQ